MGISDSGLESPVHLARARVNLISANNTGKDPVYGELLLKETPAGVYISGKIEGSNQATMDSMCIGGWIWEITAKMPVLTSIHIWKNMESQAATDMWEILVTFLLLKTV